MTEISTASEQNRNPLSVCFSLNLHHSRPLLYQLLYDNYNGFIPDSSHPAFLYTFKFIAYSMYRGCMVSEQNLFQVGSPTATQGQAGTVITVTLNLNFEVTGAIYICIVAGVKHLATKVRRYSDNPDSSCSNWIAQAVMPPLDDLEYNTTTVPLTVQVLANQKVLDFAPCGSFTYTPVQQTQIKNENGHTPEPEVKAIIPEPTVHTRGPGKRRSQSKLVSYPPAIVRRHRQRAQTCPRRRNSYGLVRVPQSAQLFNFDGEPLSLHLTTPLEDMCRDWSPDELQANRRLVKFTILRKDNHITLFSGPISQTEYDPKDVVISCIRYKEDNSFHVTSVDILYLFENICGQELGVKEKTRLRRNIQGFLPIRLAKTDRQFASFYHMIMDLPTPKPRTIEKKLKVFKWSQLKDVLDKILSKYCLSEVEPQQDKTPSHCPGAPTPNPLELPYPGPPSGSRSSVVAEQRSEDPVESGHATVGPPARLVLRYPGYPTEPTFSTPSSDLIAPNFPFGQQDSVTSYEGSLEYSYDAQGSQSPICSTASDVEAAYTQYAYDLSLQYPLDL